MSDPFMAEIRIMSFNFPPKGWALCNGQLLPINQNQALFSLLGTMYGGNGQTNFALPDLRDRVPIHVSNTHSQGERAGEEAHTLSVQEMPAHTHPARASTVNGSTPLPTGNVLASALNTYAAPGSLTTLSPETVTSTGGSQPHPNMGPFLALNYCIALQGIFPART